MSRQTKWASWQQTESKNLNTIEVAPEMSEWQQSTFVEPEVSVLETDGVDADLDDVVENEKSLKKVIKTKK